MATHYRRLTAKARAARIQGEFDKGTPSVASAIWKSAPPGQRERILSRLSPEHRKVLLAASQALTLCALDQAHQTSSERRAARLEGKATITAIRTCKFRLYPTPEQAKRLESICAAVRAVYNCENELFRHQGHPASQRWEKGGAARGITPARSASAIDPAILFLGGKLASRSARATDPTTAWLNDAPASAFASARAQLDRAWKAYAERCDERGSPRLTNRRGRLVDDRPHFRNAVDHISFELPVWTQGTKKKTCNVLFNHRGVRLPKLTPAATYRGAGPGWIVLRRHTRIEGQTKTAIIKREGHRWYLCLVVEETRLARPAPDLSVGIDLGVIAPIMTSDGDTLGVTRPTHDLVRKAKKAQRCMARCTRGSIAWRRYQKRVARYRRLRALQVRAQLHKATHRLAQSVRTVVIEDLHVKNMIASARGTWEQPGRNVAAKAGLNRAMLEVPKFGFRLMLAAKLARAGGTLIIVDPRGTSQTCSRCGHRDRRSRVTQATFDCIACGPRIHADVNAARNILARGVRGDAASPPTIGQGFLFDNERRKTEKPHAAPMSAGHRTASQAVKATEKRKGTRLGHRIHRRLG